ncbi:nucleotidyltransferase [Bacillus smithii]|uniref:nucleotidyltransferase n=1 Tax=Bacillus smithii TaxID=1479 RepID=UPI0030C8DC95
MKSAGIVVEYNPFHNGHLHHILQTKRITGAEVLIAVMSGHFLQRGEPALLSKWARAKMALHSGVDLVVELPYYFATQKAETFAFGAIALLHELGVDSFCFGSESGDIKTFEKTANLLEEQNEQIQNEVQKWIKTGISYPKAQSLAMKNVLKDVSLLDTSKPNNILGLQYIKARNRLSPDMKAYTISRKGAGYHDKQPSKSIASATGIRHSIFHPNGVRLDGVKPYVPNTTFTELKKYLSTFGVLHHWELYWSYLQYQLLSAKPEELQSIYEVEEGIEYRLIEAAHQSTSFQQFMESVKTKRYTWTRLQRMCVHILTHASKEQMAAESDYPSYIRVLGMTSKGREYLRNVKKTLQIPLIAKASAYRNLLTADIKATNIFAMGLPSNKRSALLNSDLLFSPVIIP